MFSTVEKYIGISLCVIWIWLIIFASFKIVMSLIANYEDFDNYFNMGVKCQKERKYEEAIELFKKALTKSTEPQDYRDVYNKLGILYYTKSDFITAIEWFNKSLNIKISNLDALRWRYMCFTELELYEEAYLDITIYDSLINKNRHKIDRINYMDMDSEIKNLLEKIAKKKTEEFLRGNNLSYSNVRYANFYASFEKIIPHGVKDENDLAWILETKSYDKLLSFFFNDQQIDNKQRFIKKYGTDGLFSYNLIKSTVQYLRGLYKDSVRILENPKTDLELVFREYVKSYVTDNKRIFDIQYMNRELKIKKNVTFKFWLAKYFFKTCSYSDFYNILQSIKRGKPFVYTELLKHYRCIPDTRFDNLAKEALEKFSYDENIQIECCLRYTKLKDKDNLLRIINIMDKEGASYIYFLGWYYFIIGEQHRKIEAFKKAIEIDPTYYEAYFNLGLNYSDNDVNVGMEYLRDSLKIVSSYDEAYLSMKEITRLENLQIVQFKKHEFCN